MFDFEKLEVYSKAKLFNSAISLFLENANISKNKNDQLVTLPGSTGLSFGVNGTTLPENLTLSVIMEDIET